MVSVDCCEGLIGTKMSWLPLMSLNLFTNLKFSLKMVSTDFFRSVKLVQGIVELRI